MEQICAKIVKDLKGIAGTELMRRSLDSKYKNQRMLQLSAMQRELKVPVTPVPHDATPEEIKQKAKEHTDKMMDYL